MVNDTADYAALDKTTYGHLWQCQTTQNTVHLLSQLASSTYNRGTPKIIKGYGLCLIY